MASAGGPWPLSIPSKTSSAGFRLHWPLRPGVVVNDEYDLQRIVHAVLCLHYLDVRPEKYGPSRAGVHPRLDFLLKEERIAIETKMTRNNLGPRRLGDELAQDILRYRGHDHADAYFALVYDPEKHILNASGFELGS
jgi:hypothetical protein